MGARPGLRNVAMLLRGALRRSPFSVPLAAVAALSAHTAEYGGSHTFGGAFGVHVVSASVAALALGALLLVAGGALHGRRVSHGASRDFAVRLGCEIAGGAVATYMGMEHLEGRDPSLFSWRLFALVSAAVLTLFATMLGIGVLTRAGVALATLVQESRRRFPLFSSMVRRAFVHVPSRFLKSPYQGRAPPLR